MSAELRVEPFRAEYRRIVRDCVYDTGYGGESAEIYFEDRELFADYQTLYYTDYEPESAFIGFVDGEPAGYLLGCLDTMNFRNVMNKEILPYVLKNLITGKYQIGPGVRKSIANALIGVLTGEEPAPPLEVYPAHLHIDLFKPYRRAGLGRVLIENYLDFIRQKKIPGVHLGTSSVHTLSHPFYEKMGFKRWSAGRFSISPFRHFSDMDFYSVIYVKLLSGE